MTHHSGDVTKMAGTAPARDPDDMIALTEVVRMVGMGKSTIYNRIADGTFPDRYDLGGGVIRWRYGDVDDWRKSRPRVKRAAA